MNIPNIDLKDKVVLITGGTGSFGHEFVSTVLQMKGKPKKLIIFSRDEMKQYEMQKVYNDRCMRYFIGDIRDRDRLKMAFRGVDYVVHAAAIKIVPTAEYNPFEAVKTNILGAENIIHEAIENDVKKVIALSTDKAANPINLYGATKLCAEKMFIAANNYSPEGTRFSVVRYGNVFGSRGSVVPFFRSCRSAGTVPITDTRMTRFWITLKQGVEFVLQSLEEMKGGEIFVPKLPSIRIVDLAEAVCPGAKHQITGMRPGEKIHETLVAKDEGFFTYEHENRYVICPPVLVLAKEIERAGKRLNSEFDGYTSENNPRWFTVEELRQLVDEHEDAALVK